MPDRLVAVEFGATFNVAKGLTATMAQAGNILGAAIVSLSNGQTTLTFSGDLGRQEDLIMPPPALIEDTDYLVVESTYGNRRHIEPDPMIALGNAVRETAARGGVVVIPAFAVGRAQSILCYLHLLKASNAIPSFLPIFLDSPMAD